MPKVKTLKIQDKYPHIDYWVNCRGRIEIGGDEEEGYNGSFVRAIDEGGTAWEGKSSYKDLEAVFKDLEKGLGEWIEETGGMD